MPNNNLILRTLISPWITPTPDTTKSSVLKHIDVDNNFIYLRGELIYTATTVGNLVTLKKINGNDLSFNVGSGSTGTVGGSGTTNYVSRWTPSGNTLGDSIIQDNGSTIGINTNPSTFHTLGLRTTNEVDSLSIVNQYDTSLLGYNTEPNGIDSLLVPILKADDAAYSIMGRVSALGASLRNDVTYIGVKGIVGSALMLPDADKYLKAGVLGVLEEENTSGYGVLGQVGGLTQIDGVGVKGRFRDNVGDRVNTFIGVVGEASSGKNNPSYRILDSAIGLYGTVDIHAAPATLFNAGAKFDAKYNTNTPLTNLYATYIDGVSTLSGGTITNAYGLYIKGNSVVSGAITNSYAIYQVGTGDTNYFAGEINTDNNLEVRGQAYTPIYDNLTGGTTFIPDWDNSNVQILTLSGNTNVSGGTSTMKGGSAYTMIIKQSNGGSHTITWDSTYKWEEGNPPTLSTADGSVDIITFICDGTSLYGLIAKDFQ